MIVRTYKILNQSIFFFSLCVWVILIVFLLYINLHNVIDNLKWKVQDHEEIKQEAVPKLQHDQEKMGQVLINESSEKKNSKVDLEEPLLS